jgi:phosphatidylinositol alpha-1,6-mannosyltransferase
MVLVEAMAAGVPAITSNTAGANAFVTDAGAGIVIDDLHPRTLARAVEQVLVDPAAAAAMGAAGRRAAATFHRATVDALTRAFERQSVNRGEI